MKNNLRLVIIAVFSSIILLAWGNVDKAYALSFQSITLSGSPVASTSVVRIGNKIAVGDLTADTVVFYDSSTFAVLGTVASVTDPRNMVLNQAGDRIYVINGGTNANIIEIDPVNYAILRTFASTCDATQGAYALNVAHSTNNIYCATAASTIAKINLSSLTTTFTSTAFNVGGSACTIAEQMWYNSASDTMFMVCTGGTNRLVAIEGLTSSGTPDFAYAYTNGEGVAFNVDQNNLLICSSSVAPQFVNYTAGVSFTFWKNAQLGISTGGCVGGATGATQKLTYDHATNRYFIDYVEQALTVYDGLTGNMLVQQQKSTDGTENLPFVYSNTLIYGAIAGVTDTTADIYVWDISGVAFGQGAGGGTTGATVCIDTTLDGVPDICFTDSNGDGVADNGQQGSLGVTRGNANLTDFGSKLFCSFGISTAACTNADVKTNGVGLGYLLLLIIFSYGALVFIHHKAQADAHVTDAMRINPILLLVVLMTDVGFAFYMAWISDLIFYTVVVVLGGVAGYGVYKQTRGGD